MQRVVRYTFAGLLAVASVGLTACGDKVTVPGTTTTPAGTVVHQVTVSPSSASLNVGDKITLGVSVNADAGVTDRTVVWSSSNSAIATVSAAGLVTAVAPGTATIVAASNVDRTVTGAAVVTVAGGNGNVPTVTISSINFTNGAGQSVPVNLNAVNGQIDVTLNVDSNGQPLKSVSATLKCGTDSMTRTQTIGLSADVAAAAAAAPVTLSFNTAEFNGTTGAPTLHNGACTISATATTASGVQSATNSTTLTLANQDRVIVRTTNTGATATDSIGQAWKAGAVTVSVTPVLFSTNVTPANVAITLPGAIGPTQTVTAAAAGTATTATWANAAGTNSVAGLTLAGAIDPATGTRPGVHPTVTITDNNGNALTAITQVNSLTESDIRIDNQAPTISTATYNANTQNTNAGWVGKNFVFRVSSATATDPINTTFSDAGVAGSTVATQFRNFGAAATTFATFTTPTSLPETSTATGTGSYDLRITVCDKLANCANSGTLTSFGVDLTNPTITPSTTGPANNGVYGIGATIPNGGSVTVGASDPQGANGSTGSGFSGTPVLVTDQRLAPSGPSSSATTCTIGTQASNGTCSAPAQQGLTFTATTANPGQYLLTYTVTDQAGNTSAASTVNYYLDLAAAPSTTGGVSLPSTVTAGTAFSASSTDDMDIGSANGYLNYTIPYNGNAGLRIAMNGTTSATGAAFDNALTRAATITLTMPSTFYRSLGTISATNPGTIANGVKPDAVGLRAVDVAGNLGPADVAAIPAANVTSAGTPYTVGTQLNGFSVAASPTTVSNGTATTNRSTTLTASVNATSLTATTPFTQVCFYIVTPNGSEGGAGNAVTKTAAGELTLLGCTSTNVTVDAAGARTFQYTMSFDPDALYGASGTLQLTAIGSNANGDALAAQPVTITLAN